MDKYTRTEIKHYNKDDVFVLPEYINKWVCQVNINCLHPEYLRRLENNECTTICVIIGDSWEEVNNKFNEMNTERIGD